MAFAVRRLMGFEEMDDADGATRYARPCRPVKPLEMTWLASARSERQRAQRRWEAWPVRKAEADEVEGEEHALSVLEAEALLSVLDLRRKGSEGTRYVGKRVGGEGSDFRGMLGRVLVRGAGRKL